MTVDICESGGSFPERFKKKHVWKVFNKAPSLPVGDVLAEKDTIAKLGGVWIVTSMITCHLGRLCGRQAGGSTGWQDLGQLCAQKAHNLNSSKKQSPSKELENINRIHKEITDFGKDRKPYSFVKSSESWNWRGQNNQTSKLLVRMQGASKSDVASSTIPREKIQSDKSNEHFYTKTKPVIGDPVLSCAILIQTVILEQFYTLAKEIQEKKVIESSEASDRAGTTVNFANINNFSTSFVSASSEATTSVPSEMGDDGEERRGFGDEEMGDFGDDDNYMPSGNRSQGPPRVPDFLSEMMESENENDLGFYDEDFRREAGGVGRADDQFADHAEEFANYEVHPLEDDRANNIIFGEEIKEIIGILNAEPQHLNPVDPDPGLGLPFPVDFIDEMMFDLEEGPQDPAEAA